MSDVRCASCGEPWDTWHLREDAIWETELPKTVKKGFDGKLTEDIRKAFKAVGWEFGLTLYNIRHCPGCPKGSEPKNSPMADAIEEVFGEDEDGIVTELEDLQ